MEVILETGASIELAPKTSKIDTQILEQLKTETVKDREDSKFAVSVSCYVDITCRIHDRIHNF